MIELQCLQALWEPGILIDWRNGAGKRKKDKVVYLDRNSQESTFRMESNQNGKIL